MPSKGPDSWNAFSITATLSSKPTAKLLGTVALNIWSSVLNHHPYAIILKTFCNVNHLKH